MSDNQLWLDRRKWPMDFGGNMFLFNAVLKIGKATFGDEWVGPTKELAIIQKLPSAPPSGTTGVSFAASQRLRAARPDLQFSESTTPFVHVVWTPELWAEAVKLYEELAAKHIGSVDQFHQVQQKVLELLSEGKIRTYLRDKSGGAFSAPLETSVWFTERWRNRFFFGQMNPKEPNSTGVAGDGFKLIYLNGHDVELAAANIRKPVTATEKNQSVQEAAQSPAGNEASALDISQQIYWGVLPTLVWIATRDIALASKAAKNGSTFKSEDIGLSARRAMNKIDGVETSWPCANLKGAWRQLASAMTKGEISCFADRTTNSRIGDVSQTALGCEFPPEGQQGAALSLRVDDDNGMPVLIPSDAPLAHTRTSWRNPMFEREQVLRLWPVETTRSVRLKNIDIEHEQRNPQDAYFEAWLENEILHTQRDMPKMIAGVVAKFAAERRSRSGARIEGVANMISATAASLHKKISGKATSTRQAELAATALRKTIEDWTALFLKDVASFKPPSMIEFHRVTKEMALELEADVARWIDVELKRIRALENKKGADVAVKSKSLDRDEFERPQKGARVELDATRARPSPKRNATKRAISALWSEGIPATLSAKERNSQIIDWCKEQSISPPSTRIISEVASRIDRD